jgi:dUTP pyrophosphatase
MPKENLLRFVRLSINARSPMFGSANAAGLDLFSAESCHVPQKGKCLVLTGLMIELPKGHYGRIAPRSGLASKFSIDVGAGVIDEDFRGEIKVLLFNFSDTAFEIKVGDPIAQIICERYTRPILCEASTLSETTRGDKGFGSSMK